MITKTEFSINLKLLETAIQSIQSIKLIDGRLTLNEPTGRFFYDPWTIKEEFKDTVWEEVLNSLNCPIGEARLINLEIGSCYSSHADIDDRWHLSLIGERSYLIDLDNEVMHQTNDIGIWYSMDASRRHTAANFGNSDRIQLVVRQLLLTNTLHDPVSIELKLTGAGRYQVDDHLSPWLNLMCKNGVIADIYHTSKSIKLMIEKTYIEQLENIVKLTPLELLRD